jgi:hypothetical protein
MHRFLSVSFIFLHIIATQMVALVMIPLAIAQRLVYGHSDTCWLPRRFFLRMLNVKVNDISAKDSRRIQCGFVLFNHRSFCDFAIDPELGQTTLVSRYSVLFVLPVLCLLDIIDERIFFIHRGKVDRIRLYALCRAYMRRGGRYSTKIGIYPEGTRRQHLVLHSVDEVKSMLKPGFLKSIWENRDDELPLQIVISSNKEKCFSEKSFEVSFSETIVTCRGSVIYPSWFSSFEDFYDAICSEWILLWNKVHQ